MATPHDFMLADMKAKYDERASSAAFDRLYEDDLDFGHMFSVLHKRLNEHFDSINGRARTTHHYWADPSREMIALIDEIETDLYDLKRAGIDVAFDPTYQEALERCRPWLSPSGGSSVPDDFEQIRVIKFERVFDRHTDSVRLVDRSERAKLTMVGEGSYAHVYSYVDPEYGIKFAVKRAKRGISDRDLARFKQEFQVMKGLSFPYDDPKLIPCRTRHVPPATSPSCPCAGFPSTACTRRGAPRTVARTGPASPPAATRSSPSPDRKGPASAVPVVVPPHRSPSAGSATAGSPPEAPSTGAPYQPDAPARHQAGRPTSTSAPVALADASVPGGARIVEPHVDLREPAACGGVVVADRG